MLPDLRAILTVIVTGTFVTSPLVTPPFSGFRPDQFPNPQVDPPVQPEGYAFAIWGLIYAWLVVSALFGLVARRRDPAWDHVRGPLILSLALGTPWLWIANQSAIWASVVIVLMAATAIVALLRCPQADRWWLAAPVALYAGWLTAAASVSVAVTLSGYGILLGSEGWAVALIVTALLVALSVQSRARHAPDYGAAVIWALIGIVVANLRGSGLADVGIVAAGGAILMALGTARAVARARA